MPVVVADHIVQHEVDQKREQSVPDRVEDMRLSERGIARKVDPEANHHGQAIDGQPRLGAGGMEGPNQSCIQGRRRKKCHPEMDSRAAICR